MFACQLSLDCQKVLEMNKFESDLSETELNRIADEFTRLKGNTYLDHAGASLYADSQLKNITKELTESLFLNPHTSKLTTDCIDQVRYQVLNHFNTNSKAYSIIFTSGSTAAIKLVAESFNYCADEEKNDKKQCAELKSGAFVYLQDNHTSVLGMRDIALSKKADIVCIPRDDLFSYMAEENVDIKQNTMEPLGRALFVYPAQCNFSGYRYPLEWCESINNGTLNKYTKTHVKRIFTEWAVLLDAAAFVSTNKLDLSLYKPDFVCLSFYKIFGYPTGLGALLVKNTSSSLLNKKEYYGGGTVEISLSGVNFHIKRAPVHERFEDGTISFLSILSLKHGFETLNSLIPKQIRQCTMERISNHTFALAQNLYQQLTNLRHFNNKPLATIYADSLYDDIITQGGIVNFNLLRSNGSFVGYSEVSHMAELFNIHIRTGCFCNPGACQRHLKLSNVDLRKHHNAGHICGDNYDLVDGVPTGSIRVSFGYMSTIKDIDSLIGMIKKCFLDEKKIKLQTSDKEISQKYLREQEIEEKIQTMSRYAGEAWLAKGILKEICIYPLKSCAAFRVYNSWEIGSKGLKYDRDWMIVTEAGVALTQKQDTRMSLIQPSIDLADNRLVLSFPGVKSITISLDINDNSMITENSLCNSKVCGDSINGFDCGDDIADWLMEVLGLPGLRLIRQNDVESRSYQKKGKSLLDNDKPKFVSLSNKAQYLLLNVASVKWLETKVLTREFNGRIDNLIKRFRGNLIIESKTEFEEFSWQKIKIGNLAFHVEGPCQRCQMVCIDQESGEKTVEPLRTISKEFQGKINFGAYLSHEDLTENANILQCGDIVYVEKKIVIKM